MDISHIVIRSAGAPEPEPAPEPGRPPVHLHVPSPPPPPVQSGPTCTCGHSRTAHEHYRRGKDCALCRCGRFRRPRLFSRR